MSESWSEVGPRDEESGQDGTAWSSNGKGGVAEAPTADESGQQVTAAVAVSDPDSPGETAPSATIDTSPVATDEGPDSDFERSISFLTQLARAMQDTAGHERERVVADTETRRTARIEEIRGRETAEADRMRELAAEDQSGIDAWAETETARIKAERERRAEALRTDLETSLGQHRDLIAREIEAVESAVATYRIEVATFFDALEHETDPVAIAQLATRRPVFPSLDTVPLTAEEPVAATGAVAVTDAATELEAVTEAQVVTYEDEEAEAAALSDEPAAIVREPDVEEPVAEASSLDDEQPALEEPTAEEHAVAEEAPLAASIGIQPPLVGVMDYSPDPFGDPWRDLPEKTGPLNEPSIETQASASGDIENVGDESEHDEEAPETAVASPPRGRSVLHAVPALRPMGSWLGRQANSDPPDLHG